MNKRIAVYAGSFDPATVGHIDIIEKAADICDVLKILVANNPKKKHFFPLEERVAILMASLAEKKLPAKIEVIGYDGIVASYARRAGAAILVRGIRNHVDLEYERLIEAFTGKVAPKTRTVYFTAEPENMFTSSSLVREFIKAGLVEEARTYMEAEGFKVLKRIVLKDRSEVMM